jgi:hypothetical protein
MFGLLAGAIGGAIKIGQVVSGLVKKARPVIRAASTLGNLAAGGVAVQSIASSAIGRQTVGTLPTLPISGGLPALSAGGGGGAMVPYGQQYGVSRHPMVQPEALRTYQIPAQYLRTFVRAPKGCVVIHDSQGAFAVPKMIARQAGYYHPAKKPPISARDYHCFTRAKVVEKKLRKIAGAGLRRHAPAGGGRRRKK